MKDNVFGKNLRSYRMLYHMTQQELADYLHVNRKVISNWELGKSEPCLDDVLSLAELFESTADELLVY